MSDEERPYRLIDVSEEAHRLKEETQEANDVSAEERTEVLIPERNPFLTGASAAFALLGEPGYADAVWKLQASMGGVGVFRQLLNAREYEDAKTLLDMAGNHHAVEAFCSGFDNVLAAKENW